MPQIKPIYQGTTFAPARAFLGELVSDKPYSRYIFPCVGSFLVPATVIGAGIPAASVYASDITLYSSLLGYLADPDKDPRQLLTAESDYGDAAAFVEGATTPLEFVAGMLVYIKYTQLSTKSAFDLNIKREIVMNCRAYGQQLIKRLDKLITTITGLHYEQADVRDVLTAEKDNPEAFIYFNLPGLVGGFTDQFGEAEALLGWTGGVTEREFNSAKDAQPLLESLRDASAHIVTYLHSGPQFVSGQTRIEMLPEGWHVLSANQRTPERVDYVVSNRPAKQVGTFSKFGKPIKPSYPIYNDEEITADSAINFIPVDRDTALYYRDLFVHKLGATNAERFYLMTIDGRVTTACGLFERDVRLGKGKSKDYLGEVFGISKSSKRYARLGKLFMLCLTSGDMKRLLLQQSPGFHYRTPRGIQTSSLTTHEEGKTDRSVLKLVSREERSNGQFLLIYRGDFRDDTWGDVLKMWLERWGGKQRTAKAAPAEPAPEMAEP